MCETPESNQTSRMSVSAWKSSRAKPRRSAPGGKEVGGGPGVPGVGALLAEDAGDVLEETVLLVAGVAPRIDPGALAVFHGVEQRDRRAPAPLPRDHPLAPVLDHAGDARLAPGGDPLHAGDRVERAAPDVGRRLVETGEPLDRRPEDDGILAAPAVRVLVAELRVVPGEGARGLQVLDDRRIRVEHLLPAVLRDRREPAGFVDGREDRELLALPGEEVVFAVAGRGVHEAGAGVHRDVVAEDHAERLARLPRPSARPRHSGGRGWA